MQAAKDRGDAKSCHLVDLGGNCMSTTSVLHCLLDGGGGGNGALHCNETNETNATNATNAPI